MGVFGDNYSDRRRLAKLYLQLDENVKGPHPESIISNEGATKVYLDGVLRMTRARLILRFPGRIGQTRLTVGTTLSGNQPWTELVRLSVSKLDTPSDGVAVEMRRLLFRVFSLRGDRRWCLMRLQCLMGVN
jgi:hypothetical protein